MPLAILLAIFFLKKRQFMAMFLKKCQVFGNFVHSIGNFPEGQVLRRSLNKLLTSVESTCLMRKMEQSTMGLQHCFKAGMSALA